MLVLKIRARARARVRVDVRKLNGLCLPTTTLLDAAQLVVYGGRGRGVGVGGREH